MSNPNAFTFTYGEKTCHADPMKVRRTLLQHTMGKCWSVVRKIKQSQAEIEEARNKAEEIRKDLEVNPNTPEENQIILELQKLQAENKQSTLTFDALPRSYKADMWEGKIAILSNQVAQLEGMLAEAAYEAFDLPKFNIENGSGLTESEALEILKAYLEYAEGKGERLGS